MSSASSAAACGRGVSRAQSARGPMWRVECWTGRIPRWSGRYVPTAAPIRPVAGRAAPSLLSRRLGKWSAVLPATNRPRVGFPKARPNLVPRPCLSSPSRLRNQRTLLLLRMLRTSQAGRLSMLPRPRRRPFPLPSVSRVVSSGCPMGWTCRVFRYVFCPLQLLGWLIGLSSSSTPFQTGCMPFDVQCCPLRSAVFARRLFRAVVAQRLLRRCLCGPLLPVRFEPLGQMLAPAFRTAVMERLAGSECTSTAMRSVIETVANA